MENLDLKKHSKYFFLGSFIGLIILSVVLVKPFISALLGSMILAYIFYPVYQYILKYVRNKNVASIFMSILIIILIVGPMLFLVNTLFTQSAEFFTHLSTLDLREIEEKYLVDLFGDDLRLSSYFKDYLNKFLIGILQNTDNFIFTIPQKLVSFGVMLFVMFYLFKDGDRLVDLLKRELPLKAKYKQQLEKRFSETVYATMYGLIVTAVIQGIVATIGLYIFDVQSPILFGMLMIILAMLPYLGAAIVWLPISVVKFVTGDVFNGVGLFLYGLLIVSTIDNVLKSYIIGSKGGIHPVLVLLGVLGGLQMFGLIGVIIGPLTLALFVVFIELYISEQNHDLIVLKKKNGSKR